MRGSGCDADLVALATTADDLGYAVAWVAEAYGSDAPTVLAWVGAQTHRIGLGAAVMQIPARTPAMTAMTAATLDTLSGGRVHLGLGASRAPRSARGGTASASTTRWGAPGSTSTSSGWRCAASSVRYEGEHFTLPLPDGPGKPLSLTIHPVRADLPVYLAAVGPEEPRAGRGDRRRLARGLLLPRALRADARVRRLGPPPGRRGHRRGPAGRVRGRPDGAGLPHRRPRGRPARR